jgi:alpha-1,3-mannosyltransferase
MQQLCSSLKEMGHECSVLCLDACAEGGKRLPARERFPEASVERIPQLDLRYYKLAPFGLGKLRGFDIVHVHGLGFFADYLALTKPLHKKPLVLSTHGGIFHTKDIAAAKKAYFAVWKSVFAGAFDAIVAVSQQDKNLFSGSVPEKKLKLVENGIDFERFSSIKRKTRAGTMLYFGRIAGNKGLGQLIMAFAAFNKGGGKGNLVVAGEGSNEATAKLKDIARRLGVEKKILFTGRASEEELSELMSKAEFFASASQYEGFGLTALEAMASGLIPLLNRIPAFESFVDEGSNGFIVDFSDAEKAGLQIADAVALSPAKKKAIAKKAGAFASRFDWKGKAREYERVYRQCIEREKSRH